MTENHSVTVKCGAWVGGVRAEAAEQGQESSESGAGPVQAESGGEEAEKRRRPGTGRAGAEQSQEPLQGGGEPRTSPPHHLTTSQL